MVTQGMLVRLAARPAQVAALEAFLQSQAVLAYREIDTTAWFALRFSRHEYGIFAAFPGVTARDDHLRGPIIKALRAQADSLLQRQPRIARLSILADKLPTHPTATTTSKALLLRFRAKAGKTEAVEHFLRQAKGMVQEETGTPAWFAIFLESGAYGIFDAFPDNGARLAHLAGHVPRALAAHSLSLLGSLPELEMLTVLADKMPGQLVLPE